MSGPRQNTQRELARAPDERGETPIAGDPGAEPIMAATEPESPAATSQRRCASERTSCVRGNAFEATKELRAWMG
jgi:hypothetical protein